MLKKMDLKVSEIVNWVVLPVKLIIPQPIIQKLPYLKTNEDIRVGKALKRMHGYVLDIGCGGNTLIRKYREGGGKGLGVDVYDWGEQDLIVEDTARLPFENATFDMVTMIACINHIPNREEVILESYRVLKTGGRLIITNLTPFLSIIWHKYAFWDKDQHDRGMKDGEVYGFKKNELERIMAENGFALEEKQSFSWNLNAIYVYHKR